MFKFRNWKNGNLVDFNEDCFYYLWSVVGCPLIDSFLGNLQTISYQYAPGRETVISKHGYPFTIMNGVQVRGNGVNWKDYSEKRGPPSRDYICKLRQKTTSSFFIKNVPKYPKFRIFLKTFRQFYWTSKSRPLETFWKPLKTLMTYM